MHSLRLARPSAIIVMSKIDIKSSYRRYTMWGDLAAMGVTILYVKSMLNLRKTFGGALGPYCFTDVVSEPATDLGNDLLSCPDLDGEESRSPRTDTFEPPSTLDDNVAFSPSLPVDVVVPPVKHGLIDDFVDEVVAWSYLDENWKLLDGSALLSL